MVDPARPALKRPHAREQLAEVERLDQVVVGPGVEAANPVGGRVARGEHQQRCRSVVLARPGDHVNALGAGHAPVNDRDVVLVPLQVVDGLVATFDGVDLVARVGQAEHENLAQTVVVLRHEHSHQFISLGDDPFERVTDARNQNDRYRPPACA